MTDAQGSETAPIVLGPDVLGRARTWAEQDPDPATRAELEGLIALAGTDEDAAAELSSRFAGPLEFGTAGLRGEIGAGETRMNRATVTRATAGLMAALTAEIGPDPVVVIGHDARHGSHEFARDAAEIVAGAGGRALLLPRPLPTPVLAFAVRHLGTDAGIMVTASHNPPRDNGYKVYLGGRAVPAEERGTQIVAPWDARIAEAIAAVGDLRELPRGEREGLGEEIVEAYLDRVASLVPAGAAEGLTIVHTSMHGVGAETARAALARAGVSELHEVAEQAEPDPDFPTVAFPNPEEPGALDLALALARGTGADLVIANDPDADRCSAAIPASHAAGGWRQLTGDEIGALLGDQAARAGTGTPTTSGSTPDGTSASASDGRPVLASSVVSSRLLGRIAAAHGIDHAVTLTGFKWIARAPRIVFGYEEAIGYCVDPEGVRDKDGISAAVRLAALAGETHRAGRTLQDLLDDLALAHGVHVTAPLTVRVTDLTLISRAMTRVREQPPTELGGSPVTVSLDLAHGSADLPPTDGVVWETEIGDRVVVRPSGTEPKLKCYLEVVQPVGRAGLAAAREAADTRMAVLREDVAAAIGM
ncbi:phospho-sugar mutase [Georgenia sp. Z1344]|uniref:phospho-sugar mutase n=1 Tax=Georgenia sp. Z1344 TaxID=3416706 RepID=UPI003CEC1404